MKRAAAKVLRMGEANPVERELAELGEECARVLALLERLAKAGSTGAERSEILGELSATVLHLHAHSNGLDELIDAWQED